MMKSLKIFLPIILLLGLLWPLALLAQDDSTDLSLEQALANVRAVYGNVVITEINFDEDGEDEREEACWKFHFVDGTELCVIAATGEIIVDDDGPDMVATEDLDDDAPNIVTTEEFDDAVCVDDDNDGDSGRDNDNDGDSGRGDDDDCDDLTGIIPVVTLETAISVARTVNPNTPISSVELELLNDGRLIWEIDFEGANNDVDVDATSSQIVDISGDDDNNDDGDSGRSSDDDGDSGRGGDDAGDSSRGGSDNSGSGNDDDDNDGSSERGGDDDNGGSGGSD
jgi:uncharacterized membrane protein YkoI